jgi:predicted acyl esterase
MRDGIHIFVDIYDPDGAAGVQGLPVILGWSPYGKHRISDTFRYAEAGVQKGWISRFTAFEAPDPAYWCKHGYAVAYADPRGTWYSQGEMSHGGAQESRDCYDLIEWLGTQPWCNGKVGMSGVSYLACIQWQVAPLKPPHLAAINPWEGFSDWYREFGYHGGMRDTRFVPRACSFLNWSTTRTEDTDANMRAHPLYDEYWASKDVDLDAIDVPAYVVASWSDQGLHTRGTLEGFKRMASKQKWLEVHGQKKWAHYYDPPNVERLRVFFDHFLKGTDDRVLSWPRVRLEVRDRAGSGTFRDEREWPLKRTDYRQLFLDAANGKLTRAPAAEGKVSYDSLDRHGAATFDIVFEQPVELTGHAKLRLWVEIDRGDDADLFVALQKLGSDGAVVPQTFYCMFEGPVALGWLRASQRALDPARSTPQQPYHRHTAREPLQPGVPVAVDIEIWPSSTRFAAGEGLRLIVKGRDVYDEAPENLPFLLHQDTRNQGRHFLRTGGRFDSHLLVPVIPSR